MNPFYCKLNNKNSRHEKIIEFIEKNYGNQENFEYQILDSFSIYFDEIPLDLITFISYFWLDDEYSEEDIYWNVSSFIYDNLESYMIDKISIYQVCHEIKQRLEYEDNIIVFVEAINKNDTVFRVFQKKSDYEVNNIKDIIYTNEELEKEKLHMIKNHAELLGDSLSMELKHRRNSKKNFAKIITNAEEIDGNLFKNTTFVAFHKNILDLKINIDKKTCDENLLVIPIIETINKSFLYLVEELIQEPELIDELKTKLIYLNEKLFKPRNEKRPAQLNYFCKLINDNCINHITSYENEIYLPIVLDLIIAPYLIHTIDKKDKENSEFFQFVNDKNIYTYLVKYFAQTLQVNEKNIRDIMRFIHTEDNTMAKRFATQKIEEIPKPPINIIFNTQKILI